MASKTESSTGSAASGTSERWQSYRWLQAGLAILFGVALVLVILNLLGQIALWQMFGVISLFFFFVLVLGGLGLYAIETSKIQSQPPTYPELRKRRGFILSLLVVVLGAFLGLSAATSYGRILEPQWQILSVLAIIALAIGIIGVYFFQTSDTQLSYLELLESEKLELKEYKKLLDESGIENQMGSNSEIDLKETRFRIDAGIEQLGQAKYAVYREDFVSFLSTYYRVNALRIFIYSHLDSIDSSNGSRRVDWSFDLDLQELPDRHVREEGSIEVPQSDESKTRLWNLTRWLWSISRSLPQAKRTEVDDYLLDSDKKLKQSQSPQTLYRALSVVHAWDIQRLSAYMTIKRGLQLFVPALTVLLIVSIAIMVFTETPLSALTLNTAPDASPGVTDSPWFIVPVVLAGVLGSIFSRALFMHDPSSDITTYSSLPDPRILRETLLMGMLIGGISALVVYVLLLSGIGNIIFSETIRQDPLSVLFVAFLSGYSESFVRRALERAEGQIEKNTEAGPDTPSGEVPNE